MTTPEPAAKKPILIFLRGLIVAVAAFELFHFSDGYRLAFDMLTGMSGPWFDILFALGVGVIAPLCALAAAGLAIANRRLGLAAFLLAGALLVYWAPVIAFAIAVMIYGF